MRSHSNVWISYVIASVAACNRESSPVESGPRDTPLVETACTVDDDCVWVSGCCNDCTSYSGRSATDPVTTRAVQEKTDRDCEARRESCPHVNCVSPPPCSVPLVPACVEGKCVVKASGAPAARNDSANCDATACGPAPAFGDATCDGFAQAVYERCACLAGGRPSCPAMLWPQLCGNDRAQCAAKDPSPAIAKALAGCEGG